MVNDIFKDDPYSMDPKDKSQFLITALKEEFSFQYNSSTLFRKICQAQRISPKSTITNLEDLPFLPVQYFKEAGKDLKVDSANAHRYLQSSAISGDPSTITIDKETSKRQIHALVSVLGDFIGKDRRPFLVCDSQPAARQSLDLAARTAAMQGFLWFSTESHYLLSEDLTLAIQTLKDAVKALDTPVAICGFTFLIFASLLKPLQDLGETFELPKGSKLIHIGGWKKLEDQKIDRSELMQMIHDTLGISKENVVDIYGFTEQMGTLYAECQEGYKHCPIFTDLVVRDPYSLRPIKKGRTGIGQFFSLVPHSYPGFSLLTDDLVQVFGDDTCKCGRKGTRFKILGRSSTAEIRGCGDIIAEKLFSKNTESTKKSTEKGFIIEPNPTSNSQQRPIDWEALKHEQKEALSKLKSVSVDDIIGVIQTASLIWEEDKRFAPYLTQGLGYIIYWLRSGQLQSMTDQSFLGKRLVLDSFSLLDNDHRKFRALPRGVVVHWMAGNVPTLGIISLLLSLITKNTNIVKLPSNSPPLLSQIVDSISKVTYQSKSGRTVSGQVIADAITLLKVPHDSPDSHLLSEIADVRIAWGGAEAVKNIMSLPKQYNTIDIIFGPKLSLSCIGREALQTSAKASRLARNIAVDCSVFDQEACASAHTVFVEKGGNISPWELANLLNEKMSDMLQQIPTMGYNDGTLGRVKSARMQHFLDGDVIHPRGLEWSILYREKLELADPVYGRSVMIREIDDLAEVAPLLSRDNQVVGLALPTPRRNHIAELYVSAGVDRITSVGHMANFSSPWDGVFPMNQLVRWVSLA